MKRLDNLTKLQGQFEVNADTVIKIQNRELNDFDDVIKYLTDDIERCSRSIIPVDVTESLSAQARWKHTNKLLEGRLHIDTAILGKIQHGDYEDIQHLEDKMVMMRNKKGHKLNKERNKLGLPSLKGIEEIAPEDCGCYGCVTMRKKCIKEIA